MCNGSATVLEYQYSGVHLFFLEKFYPRNGDGPKNIVHYTEIQLAYLVN